MDQLVDGELTELWSTALSAMQMLGLHDFVGMIINAGDNRNHAHLHLKIRFAPKGELCWLSWM